MEAQQWSLSCIWPAVCGRTDVNLSFTGFNYTFILRIKSGACACEESSLPLNSLSEIVQDQMK